MNKLQEFTIGEEVIVQGDNLERITRFFVGVDVKQHPEGQYVCSLFKKDDPDFLNYTSHWESITKNEVSK